MECLGEEVGRPIKLGKIFFFPVDPKGGIIKGEGEMESKEGGKTPCPNISGFLIPSKLTLPTRKTFFLGGKMTPKVCPAWIFGIAQHACL